MTTVRLPSILPAIRTNTGQYKDYLERLANLAGVSFNGDQPWDMQVHDERVYQRIMLHGSLGGGEAYMDGWWDCDRLDTFFERILLSGVNKSVETRGGLLLHLAARLQNLQSPDRAAEVAHKHYNLSPDLYRAMLDDRMIYSCGYWANASNLDEAQEAKLDLVCRKLRLEPGMRLLDIGCGWGGAARFAAERYGVSVTGITVSEEQVKIACDSCVDLDIKIELADYRSLPLRTERYDRIMSIGMFEHVGYKNYNTYFDVARKLLQPDGLFLLHSIVGNESLTSTDQWIDKYIFSHGVVPSPAQITKALEGRLVIEDVHNFGTDYDTTLMAWHRNFVDAWPRFQHDYDQRFYRMWTYYLLMSAGAFRSRSNQVWQLLLSPRGVSGGLASIR